MVQRNDIIIDAVTKIPIRRDEIKEIDQTIKYTILKNGAYYVHNDWDKNHKVRGKVVVPCPQYGH